MDKPYFPNYPWLQAYWDKLTRYLQQDRLPSALMLVGDEGLGLSSLAKSFAHRTICLSPNEDNTACGVCESCLLFNAGNYPDFYHLVPEEGKETIKVDAIRELTKSLALSSQYTKPRIVIIDPADAMLHQAANSLLKTLEEPSENTCLVLVTHRLSRLPATIRSRCQLMVVKDIELVQAQSWLNDSGCKQASQYLRLANNVPLLAHELWKKDALAVEASLLNDFLALLKGRLDPLLFAEKCIKLNNLPCLKWLMSGLNDAIKYAHGTVNHELVHPERLADLKVLVEKLNLADMHDLLDQLAQLKVLESHQVNQQLMIEEFAIQSYSLTLK